MLVFIGVFRIQVRVIGLRIQRSHLNNERSMALCTSERLWFLNECVNDCGMEKLIKNIYRKNIVIVLIETSYV